MGEARAEGLPSVYDYIDYRAFLRDWFEARKAQDDRFSYRVFARAGGLSSPSLLVHVKKGERNLTDLTTPAVCKAMDLNDDESAHFELLVTLDQAANEEDRVRAWEAITATSHFRSARTIEGAAWACIAQWYNAAIHELVKLDDFRPDPDWIASRLWPDLSAEQAKDALAQLRRVGLVVEEEGSWRNAEAALVTPPQVTDLAVETYHQSMLRHAADSIGAVPAASRHVGAVTVSVPLELVPRLKREIAAFERHILNLCDQAEGERQAVYQLGVQLFPLTTEEGV